MNESPRLARPSSILLIPLFFGILLTGCSTVPAPGAGITTCGDGTGGEGQCIMHSPPTAQDTATYGCTTGWVCDPGGLCQFPGTSCKTSNTNGSCSCACR